MGADIAQRDPAHGEKPPLGVERELGLDGQVAALIVADKGSPRSPCHLTGRPTLRAAHGNTPYSAKKKLRVPKLPPISPQTRGHSQRGTPSTREIPLFPATPLPVPA